MSFSQTSLRFLLGLLFAVLPLVAVGADDQGTPKVKAITPEMPLPTLFAAHLAQDFVPNGHLDQAAWKEAVPVRVDHVSDDGKPFPDLSTTVRALWSDGFLYLGYECSFTRLTVFDPPKKEERIGLWDKDVVEAFIGTDAAKADHYTEYEWAPNGEQLDLLLDLPKRDFAWSSGMESAVSVDEGARVWRVEVRIPMKALAPTPPAAGVRWRINLFRRDTASKGYLAFSPTFTDTYHTPARFGWLELK